MQGFSKWCICEHFTACMVWWQTLILHELSSAGSLLRVFFYTFRHICSCCQTVFTPLWLIGCWSGWAFWSLSRFLKNVCGRVPLRISRNITYLHWGLVLERFLTLGFTAPACPVLIYSVCLVTSLTVTFHQLTLSISPVQVHAFICIPSGPLHLPVVHFHSVAVC